MISYIGKDKLYKDGYKYHSSIILIGIEYGINDFVVYKEEYIEKEHKAKIYYSKRENRPYFIAKDGRHYIDDFVNCYGMAM
jgi:hypothetical protein